MDGAELAARLSEAAAEELAAVLAEHLGDLDVRAARRLLRNPHVTAEMLDELAGCKSLLSSYEVRRELARHPRTPQIHAMRFVPSLYWRDLMELGLDLRARPVVRRAAERHLVDRLQGLAVGERMSIARRASRGVLLHLRFDPHPRVIAAFLENPRLTEGLLMPLVTSESALPEILRLVSESRRWGFLYAVRLALVRNPRTPPVVSVGLLPRLKRADQQSVARDHRLVPAVRQQARRLLEGGDAARPGGP